MGDNRSAPDLPEALFGLLRIARNLLHTHLSADHYQQAQVLAHISGVLTLARESPNCTKSSFLEELVVLCQWQNKTPISWWSFQRKSPKPSQQPVGFVDPKTWLCQEAEQYARGGFLAYASCSTGERNSLRYFRLINPAELVTTRNTDNPVYGSDSVMEGDVGEDFPDFVVNDLYTTLSKYSRCDCVQLESHSEPKSPPHEARLRLTGRSPISRDFAVFDLHFYSYSKSSTNEQFRHWRQLRLRVSRKRTELKTARFGRQQLPLRESVDFIASQRVERPRVQDKFMSKKKFCALLREDDGHVKVCLQVRDQHLIDLNDPDATDQRLAHELSIPLAQVLTSYDLSSKMKLALGFTLAQSMWQYYDSEWTSASWSTHSIQFMREMQKSTMKQPLITCRPFFEVRFRDEDDVIPECSDLPNIAHRYPRVLSLGILLISIGLGEHYQNTEQERFSAAQRINNACTLGQEISSDRNWPPFGHSDKAAEHLRALYREATRACFDGKLFKPICDRCKRRNMECLGKSTADCTGCLSAEEVCLYKGIPRSSSEASTLGAQSRRNILREKVVSPLRRALHLVNWEDSLDTPEIIPLKSAGRNSGGLLNQIRKSRNCGDPQEDCRTPLQQESYSDNVQFYDDSQLCKSESSDKVEEYRIWKENFCNTASDIDSKVLTASKRLKIAVLDTGLDKSHHDIEAELHRVRIYDDKNYVFDKPKDDDIMDSRGHGTHIVGLILEYTTDAYVYVADVTDGGQLDHGRVERALRCAVDAEVDIISISFGFQQSILGGPLEDAIDYATGKKVHIFAAASNQGGNAGRSWPARYDRVFCIHSTDAMGNPSRFNPTALEAINFATVGEAVESSWPKSLSLGNQRNQRGHGSQDGANTTSTQVKSGTSFATPIAASLAAFILRYAKTNLDPEYQQRLRRHSVMGSVLKSVMGEKRYGFYYLRLRFKKDDKDQDIKSIMIKAIKESG